MGQKKLARYMQYNEFVPYVFPDYVQTNNDDLVTKKIPQVTFCVTNDCNMACTYCYELHKEKNVRMSFETAKKVIDDILLARNGYEKMFSTEVAAGISLDFIGGEPLLEVDLMDQIVDYFREQAIKLNHPFAEFYMVAFTTNGTLCKLPKVKAFIEKNLEHLSMAISIDGCKSVHDSCRIFPDGSPTYDIAHDAAKYYQNRGFSVGNKITLSPNNIHSLAECFITMIQDGYEDIHANCVYEKGWTVEHATTIYYQCKIYADWRLKHPEYKDVEISFIDNRLGIPEPVNFDQNWCGGTGDMLAVDSYGYLYPCTRYAETSLNGDMPPIMLGTVDKGYCRDEESENTLKCLKCVTRRTQSTDACYYCPIAAGCGWCSAFNYQCTGSVDKRLTYICETHKARVLAAVYYNNVVKRELFPDEFTVRALFVPECWAVPIIGQKEYNYLKELTLKLGGYVNERNATKIVYTGKNGINEDIDLSCIEYMED